MNQKEIEILKKELPKMINILLGYKSSIPELEDVTIVGIQFKKIADYKTQFENLKVDSNEFKADDPSADIQPIIKPDFFHPMFHGPTKTCFGADGRAFLWPAFKPCP